MGRVQHVYAFLLFLVLGVMLRQLNDIKAEITSLNRLGPVQAYNYIYSDETKNWDRMRAPK